MDTPKPEDPPPPPSGLLALILLPLQAFLGIGLRLFSSLVSGILSAVFPIPTDHPDTDPKD